MNTSVFKYITLSFLFLIAKLPHGFAQDNFFQAHLRLGGNFSQVDGDAIGGYNKVGLHTGIGVSHKIAGKNHHIGFEILYSQKGSVRRIDPKDPSPQIFRLYFDYIEFPILYEVEPEFLDNSRLYIGPSIGANINAKRDEGFGKQDAQLNRFEIGLNLGLKYYLSDRLAADVRHSYSLFRVGDNFANGLNIFNRVGMYNRLFTVALSYDI
jgi:hypothetical protein